MFRLLKLITGVRPVRAEPSFRLRSTLRSGWRTALGAALRLGFGAALLAAVGGAAGCKAKPSEEECLMSFQKFLMLSTGGALSAEELAQAVADPVNREMAASVCRDRKTREQVLCEINAQTLEALKACAAEKP